MLISFHGGQPPDPEQAAAAAAPLSPFPFPVSPGGSLLAAILMKINMPLVGVAAYDFDICRHFALVCGTSTRCIARNAENNITIKIMKEYVSFRAG